LGNYRGNQNRQKKRKKKICEPNEQQNWVLQQNEQFEKLLISMFKHNSLQLGLQLLFLGWMTIFTMIFKWVSKHIHTNTWGHNKQECKHGLNNNHESTK
jgi:hypothetical protein